MMTLLSLFNAYDKNRRSLTEAKLLAIELAGFVFILLLNINEHINPSANPTDRTLVRGILLYCFLNLCFKLQERKFYLMLPKILKLSGFYLLAFFGVLFSILFFHFIKAI